jgi:pimeloyl-ACP methyl ester carboxylesterase
VIRRARVAFASAFVCLVVVSSCSSASTAVVTTTTVPSVKSVPIDSFPVVDLKGVNGQWVADDVHLTSDGSGSVCLGTPLGPACSGGGSPSFAVLQAFWSMSDGSAGPTPRDFASAVAGRFTRVAISSGGETLCTSNAVSPDGVAVSMFRCYFPWSKSLDGIKISYFDSTGVEWDVVADGRSAPWTELPTPTNEDDFVVVAPNRRVYFPCHSGAKLPIVLLSGLGNPSSVWSDVLTLATEQHPELALCVFERAGLGQSDPAAGDVQAADAVDDLVQALNQRSINTPILLVGASYGGLVSQLFARLHPERVAGVVLVDSIHPDLDSEIEKILPPAIAQERRGELGGGPEAITFADLLASDASVNAAPPFPEVPLVVLRHGVPFESSHADFPSAAVESLWAHLEDQLAALSQCSAERVAERSGHRIHQDQPDLVLAAIVDVADSISANGCRL